MKPPPPDPPDITLLLPQITDVRRPAPSRLLALWLSLPLAIDTPEGRIRFQSSLRASLDDCRTITHRDAQGNVIPDAHAGSWLGAMGYLALLDQVGGAVTNLAPYRTPGPGTSDVERALAHFTSVNEDDGVCLYALRNSLTHHFSLVNLPRAWRQPSPRRITPRDRQMTRRFTLTRLTDRLIEPPAFKWNPMRPNRTNATTTVDVQLLGDLVEGVVRELSSVYAAGALRIRTDPPVTPALWRVGRFFWYQI